MKKIINTTNKTLIISILLLFITGCSSVKINKNEEKIGVLNEDYFLETQKMKNKYIGIITFNVFLPCLKPILSEKECYEQPDSFYVRINGVTLNNEELRNKNHIRVVPNQKYNIDIGSIYNVKQIKIFDLLVKESDSIVINSYLKDYIVLD